MEKSRVSDSLKDALIKSPLEDNIFGLLLTEVQKHLSQTPPPVKVNVSPSGNNSKRGSSSARGSSFPSRDKRRKVIIDEGNKGGPKKFSVPRSKPGRFRGGKRANPST